MDTLCNIQNDREAQKCITHRVDCNCYIFASDSYRSGLRCVMRPPNRIGGPINTCGPLESHIRFFRCRDPGLLNGDAGQSLVFGTRRDEPYMATCSALFLCAYLDLRVHCYCYLSIVLSDV